MRRKGHSGKTGRMQSLSAPEQAFGFLAGLVALSEAVDWML